MLPLLNMQILARDDLCVESEGVLLELVLQWAEDKVGEHRIIGGLIQYKHIEEISL